MNFLGKWAYCRPSRWPSLSMYDSDQNTEASSVCVVATSRLCGTMLSGNAERLSSKVSFASKRVVHHCQRSRESVSGDALLASSVTGNQNFENHEFLPFLLVLPRTSFLKAIIMSDVLFTTPTYPALRTRKAPGITHGKPRQSSQFHIWC